jgi:hypothetical protein
VVELRKESDAFQTFPILVELLDDDVFDCVSESGSIDGPELAVLHCSDGCCPLGDVEECDFSKT